MKVQDFYLIESLDISLLDESQKKFLDEQLTLYQEGSSVIEKVTAIDKIISNDKLNGFQYSYNEWLFSFVTKQLEIATTEEETKHLQKILGNSYHESGRMHYYKSNYNRALSSYKEAAKIREKHGDNDLLLRTYHNICGVYHIMGDITNAIETHEKSEPLIKYVKDKLFLARYYTTTGSIIGNQGNSAKSLEYFHKSLKICEENSYGNEAVYANRNIGFAMESQNELKTALKYYSKALEICKKSGYKYEEAALLLDVGDVYEKKKENDLALFYYNKAMRIQKKLNFKNKLAESYLQIGSIYENQNQYNLALQYYYKCIELSEKIEYKFTLSPALSKTGVLEIRNGYIEKARDKIELGFSLAKEIGYSHLIKDAARAKVALALAMENFKLAYEMECLKNQMKDSIQNEESRKEVIKLQYQYEKEKALLKKDLEIEVEKKNALLMEEQSDLLELKNEELATKNKIINKQVKELEDLIQKLQESNESLNQFAAVAAHDLKAPLRNIQGFSQLLHQKYTSQLPEEDLVLFMHIINSCLSLKQLIDGLLSYSTISNIKLKLDCVDLSELVTNAKNNLTTIIKETKVDLHIADGLPKVTGQYSLLFQVILNFINNAIKFRRKEKGIQPAMWINSEYYNDDQVKISIKDNGIGIEKEHQDKIFGIFKKLHSSSEYEGSGIGLSVCKKIIERLGGKVWLESEKNVGTTFFFTLKLHSILK